MTIRHNCELSGCYIKVQTPDWSFLDNSFSGKISVSDVDGVVEANGRLLIIEWKKTGVEIPTGQRIMFEKITKVSEIVVFVVWGCPISSIATDISIYSKGGITFAGKCNNDNLQSLCSKWESKVRNC